MQNPVEISIDVKVGATYVRYTDARIDESLDLVDTGSVTVDVDDAGNIVGLEILWLDDAKQIAVAARYAAEHDLGFPRDLAGNLVATA